MDFCEYNLDNRSAMSLSTPLTCLISRFMSKVAVINQMLRMHAAKNGSLVLLVSTTWTTARLSQNKETVECYQKSPQTLSARRMLNISKCTILRWKPDIG